MYKQADLCLQQVTHPTIQIKDHILANLGVASTITIRRSIDTIESLIPGYT